MNATDREKGVWPADELPDAWAWAPFGDVFKDRTSSDKKVRQGDYLESGALLVIDQGQASVGGYTDDTSLAYDGPLPAIVFGDHTKCVKFVERKFAQGADGVRILTPTSAFVPRLAYLALAALRLPDKGYSRHFRFLKASLFPVPPIAEQERIVAKVEEVTARSRRAKEILDVVPPLLDQLRRSILAAAFRGDLTADWRAKNPNIESVDGLMAHIRAERRARWEADELVKLRAKGKPPTDDRWKARYAAPTPAATDNLPELPASWAWARVEELATKVVDGVHKTPSYVTSGVPFLTVKNLTAGPGISFDDVNYITPADHEEYTKRTDPEFGDILISKDGTLGVTRLVGSHSAFSIFVSLALVKPVLRQMGPVLELAFQAPVFQERFVRTGTGLQHIHLGDLRNAALPIMPLAEQDELVRRVCALLNRVAAFEELLADASRAIPEVEVAVLAKAFRGELVPQDPDDEPASVLLDRIRSVRDGAQSVELRTRGLQAAKKSRLRSAKNQASRR